MVRVYELKNWAFSLKRKMSWKLKEGGWDIRKIILLK